jgi:hypothetical protein
MPSPLRLPVLPSNLESNLPTPHRKNTAHPGMNYRCAMHILGTHSPSASHHDTARRASLRQSAPKTVTYRLAMCPTDNNFPYVPEPTLTDNTSPAARTDIACPITVFSAPNRQYIPSGLNRHYPLSQDLCGFFCDVSPKHVVTNLVGVNSVLSHDRHPAGVSWKDSGFEQKSELRPQPR